MVYYKKLIAKYCATYYNQYNKLWKNNAHLFQKHFFLKLINQAIKTEFGQQYSFNLIKNINDFQNNIPIFNYEKLKIYIEKIKSGYSNILCKKKILYLAKTSGTTSGIKYIPITREALSNHTWGIKTLLLNYMYLKKNFSLLDGKMLFLQGSPILKKKNSKIPIGRLSGIIDYYIPKYLKKHQLPSWETNCIENWEKKINKIVEETSNQNITVIGGIPP